MNAGEIWVTMAPSADYDATLAAIEATVAGYPGLDRAVTTYASDRIEEVLGSTGRDVAVRVYGQDLDVLQAKAEEVRSAISGVAGVNAPSVQAQVMQPTVEIEVDLEKAAEYQLKAGDVRRAATSLLSGIEVGNLFEDQKVFEVVVWGEPSLRIEHVERPEPLDRDADQGSRPARRRRRRASRPVAERRSTGKASCATRRHRRRGRS